MLTEMPTEYPFRETMKQTAHSLLILLAYPFMTASPVPAPSYGGAGTVVRHTPVYCTCLREDTLRRFVRQMSSSLRSSYPTRLGEERIRSLVHGLCLLLLACCLSVPGVAATPDDSAADEKITAAIRAQIATMEQWADADIRVEFSRELKNADLPAVGEDLRMAPEGLTIGRRNVLAPIEVLRDGKPVRSFWVPAVVHVNAMAVTAARRIAAGEIVSATDVREVRMETTDLGVEWVRNVEGIIGKTVRRGFAVGDQLPADAFIEPCLVRRGDTVSLRLERDGIVLTSTAKAVEDGRLGEVIRIKNVDFSSVLRARVTGRSMVTLQ